MKGSPELPLPVKRGLRALGEDVSAARKRRRLTMEALAQRALVTRQTIARIENGDDGVAIGTYACVLFALGMADRLFAIARLADDQLGIDLEAEQLPTRVRTKR